MSSWRFVFATIRHFPALRPGGVSFAVLLTAHAALALEITPTGKELRTERQWLKERLLECKLAPVRAKPVELSPPPPQPGLDVFANNDAVIQNGRGTNRMKIGDKEYSRGFYCHAVSK